MNFLDTSASTGVKASIHNKLIKVQSYKYIYYINAIYPAVSYRKRIK